MRRRRTWVLVMASGLALLSLGPGADEVAAECFGFDRWPSFLAAARSAGTIVIGHVVEGYDEESTSRFVTFALEVDEVLRGRARHRLVFRDVGGPGFLKRSPWRVDPASESGNGSRWPSERSTWTSRVR